MQCHAMRILGRSLAVLAIFSTLPLAQGVHDTERSAMNKKPEVELQRISYVMLGVRELSRSLAFYRDILGMSVESSLPDFAFLNGGGVTLALSEELGKAKDYRTGAVELVFAVEDVHGAFTALTANGVTFHRQPRQVTESNWAANFADPDGHELSIFGPPGELVPN